MKSNSWIIVRKATGEVVMETFNPDIVKAINRQAYHVFTAYDWLVHYNAKLREA